MDIQLFKVEIKTAIAAAIKRCKQSGTVAMSRENLWQVTRLPNSANGPAGPNAPWVARGLFNEVISDTPAFCNFASL